MDDASRDDQVERDPSYTDAFRQTGTDLIKIAVTGGALAFMGIAAECSRLSEEFGMRADLSNFQIGLTALDVGAGAFAGYTGRIRASAIVLLGSFLPDFYEMANSGRLEEVGTRMIAKTIAYGGSYALGFFSRDIL